MSNFALNKSSIAQFSKSIKSLLKTAFQFFIGMVQFLGILCTTRKMFLNNVIDNTAKRLVNTGIRRGMLYFAVGAVV